MNRNKKNDAQHFEELVFYVFGQVKNYDKMRHNILRAREIMLAEHPSHFKSLLVRNQFLYCITITNIAAATVTANLSRFTFTKNSVTEGTLKMSLDNNFKQPQTVLINQKTLK